MKQLTVCFFGNMNNAPFLIAEGFRALGHVVKIFITRPDLLSRPESVYPYMKDNYPDWVLDYSRLTDDDFIHETKLVDDAIAKINSENYDLVILNDAGLSISNRIIAPCIALLTGSDLTYYANYDSVFTRTNMWDPNFLATSDARDFIVKTRQFIERQRLGIKKALVVCFPHRGFSPLGDWLLDSIGVKDDVRTSLHVSSTDLLASMPPSGNKRMVVLSPCRIVFQNEIHVELSSMDFKGTDILLKGFALYCRQGGLGVLRLIKKGQDVGAAEALSVDLGINKRIIWLEEIAICELRQEMVKADLICDQFGVSLPGLVTTDAYALGRPVMANLRNDVFSAVYPEPFPGFDAKTPEEVSDWLLHLDSNRTLLRKIGELSREYAEKYLSPTRVAEQILEKIAKNRGKKLFNIEFLHVIREFEYLKIIERLPLGLKVLEIGGGTGYQARRLTDDGYTVISIDIQNSNYADQLVFPVKPYDGRNIPFPDGSFDVVFSSNVLEHVLDLPYLQAEMKRVLKPGGYCVHLMPTGAWRLWTNVAHYTELVQRLIGLTPRLVPRRFSKHAFADAFSVLRLMAGTAKHYAIVPRHGEAGNALSEIMTFSSHHWKVHFKKQLFTIDEATPVGLFYTGHMILGHLLSMDTRQKLAKWLGSACVIYVVRPQ